MRLRVGIALLVCLVLLAGCAGISPGDTASDDGPNASATDVNESGVTTETAGGDGDSSEDGTNGSVFENRGDPRADRELPTSETEVAFREESEQLGFTYDSIQGEAQNGNDGVYAVDYDRDLETDVLAIGGGDPVLFRNDGGEFEQSDALPDVPGQVQGALFFDHDNDGWEDLLVLRHSDTPLFLENDEGEFETADVGFDREFVEPTSASAADYDGDGCLDVFVGDYNDWSLERPTKWGGYTGGDDNGSPNALYQGSCGEFSLVQDAGIEGEHWSLATSFTDVTGDGRPDIHVANDFWNDVFYVNDGNGSFDRRYLSNATDRNGMSSQVADVTGDGSREIFVTNVYFPRGRIGELPTTDARLFSDMLSNFVNGNEGNNLLVWTGDGFEDQAEERYLDRGGWGWGSAIRDFDSDGELDVFHGNQIAGRFGGGYPRFTKAMVYVQHDDEFVRQNSSAIGIEENDDRGVAALDVDRSGTMDIAVATFHEQYDFYRNVGEQGNSLQVVVGPGERNHTTVGTRIEATVGNTTHHRVHDVRSDYQSQDARTHHFGVGDAERIDELRIEWPNGTTRTFEDVATGQRVLVTPDGISERLPYEDGA